MTSCLSSGSKHEHVCMSVKPSILVGNEICMHSPEVLREEQYERPDDRRDVDTVLPLVDFPPMHAEVPTIAARPRQLVHIQDER